MSSVATLPKTGPTKSKTNGINPRLSKNNRSLSDKSRNSSFEEALHALPIGFSIFDANQNLVFCNKKYCEIYKLPAKLVKEGTSFQKILEYHIADTTSKRLNKEDRQGIKNWISRHVDKIHAEKTFSQINRSFGDRQFRVYYTKLRCGGWVDLQEDVTEQLRAEKKVSYLAAHDALTGLDNRYSFEKKLKGMLSQSRRGDSTVGVILFDLDGFKSVNDHFGHPFADKILKEIAKRIRAVLRSTSVFSRLGGDEFVICDQMPRGALDATAVCKRLLATFQEPFVFEDGAAKLSASFGIAFSPHDGQTSIELLKNADLAMYRSKKQGGNAYHFFEQQMDDEMRKRMGMENDLRQSIKNGDFELFYQPIAQIDAGKITGCEALLRWNHPERGVVSPAEFIPVAEETGLINQLGGWILNQALKDASGWPEDIRIAINISPIQLRSDEFVGTVRSALASSGIDPGRVELEITESAILEGGSAKMHQRLSDLKELGLRIALDDFGTGFSSLSHVHSFPVDRIKIDGSFVHGLGEDSTRSLGIIRSLTQLARSLGIETTAECVETGDQLSVIEAEGCTEIQGYYFSRPVNAKELSFDKNLPSD